MRYPHARVVVLGLCPGNDHPTPLFGTKPSVSASRMASLVPDWHTQALGANAWSTRSDYRLGCQSNVRQILRDTTCSVVVALGRIVQDELNVPGGSFLTWATIRQDDRLVRVLRFPHPSGLNRYWNDPQHVIDARKALRRALWTPPYERSTMFP